MLSLMHCSEAWVSTQRKRPMTRLRMLLQLRHKQLPKARPTPKIRRRKRSKKQRRKQPRRRKKSRRLRMMTSLLMPRRRRRRPWKRRCRNNRAEVISR